MATFLANEINTRERYITGLTAHVQIMFPKKLQGIWRHFFLGRRLINNQRKSNFMWYNMLHWKIIKLICCARMLPKVSERAVFVSIVAWKQTRWPLLFVTTFLLSSCPVTTAYQVSSKIYGGFFYLGITLDPRCVASKSLSDHALCLWPGKESSPKRKHLRKYFEYSYPHTLTRKHMWLAANKLNNQEGRKSFHGQVSCMIGKLIQYWTYLWVLSSSSFQTLYFLKLRWLRAALIIFNEHSETSIWTVGLLEKNIMSRHFKILFLSWKICYTAVKILKTKLILQLEPHRVLIGILHSLL